MQRAIVGMALDLLEYARAPRTTVQTPFSWPVDDWRRNFMHISAEQLAELREAGAERREQQALRRERFEKV